MAPAIPAGAEVRVRCGEPAGGAGGAPGPGASAGPAAGPAVGEVWLLVVNGRPVVHRVVARAPDLAWVLTRGDAALLPDPPASAGDLVGRVLTVRRGEGHEPPPPGPASPGRRLALALAVAVLRRSPAAGRRLVGLLWVGRRVLVQWPRAAWGRLRGGAGP
jgi:hypothetical protein